MRPCLMLTGVLSACAMLVCSPVGISAAERDDAGVGKATELAAEVDRTLLPETGARPEDLAPPLGDEAFLRRLSLDLIGVPPSPNQISLFALDPAPEKRVLAAERMLNDPRFGRNFARYWRDVILYRRSDDRALLTSGGAEEYLTQQFNAGAGWDDIATAFITATGDVREEGTTALIMAQMGQAEETAAEVSRIFLGIQIHCAQCHDHPTDRWKRKQFHELAAFFPRTAVRPVRDGERYSFEVVSVERRRFGFGGGNRGGSSEHYMPDLEDPASRGTLIQPKLFATDQQLGSGRSDLDRRQTLASWITSTENPWFAKAFVNRTWSQLVGTGFYEPVDDMGPERNCNAPETLELLSREFASSGYDVKRLLLSIVGTDAYQRSSRERGFGDAAPFAANAPQRLRADQLFDAISEALGLSGQAMNLGGRGRGMRMGMGMGSRFGIGGLRFQFAQTFGYDPSTPQDELAGAIPQALMLMNSPVVNGLIKAESRFTSLGRLIAETDDNEEVAVELYLRCLSREPTENELSTCLDHIRNVGDRREAFEDVLWALVNSTEFLYRR